MGINRRKAEGHSTISLFPQLCQNLWLWPLVRPPRRPKSEPLVRTQNAGYMIPLCTGFSDLTVKTCRKCACISSEFITRPPFHVVNLAASAKAKMDSSCKQILSSMSGMITQALLLYRDFEVASIRNYWTAALALRRIWVAFH